MDELLPLKALLTNLLWFSALWTLSSSLFAGQPGAPVTWADDFFVVIPSDLKNPIAVAAGANNVYALQADGRVRILNNVYYPDLLPPDNATNVTAIDIGYGHVLALRQDGTVVAWGIPTHIYQSAIIGVPSGLSNVVAVSAGFDHSLALKFDGTVVAWGAPNPWGTLDVPASLTNVVSVAAGQGFSMAVVADGTIRYWGNADYYGITTSRAAMKMVKKVALSLYGDCVVLRTNSTIVAWQGAPSQPWINPPTKLTNVVEIRAGFEQAAALLADGSLVVWSSRTKDSTLPNGLRGILDFDCGQNYNIALTAAPRFARSPESISVLAGGDAVFEAKMISDGQFRYQWNLNGSPIMGATNLLFAITNAQKSNAGAYTVESSNIFGSDLSQQAILSVVPSQPRIVIDDQTPAIVPGQPASIKAHALGTDPITFEWHQYGPFNQDLIVSTNADVFIEKLEPSDGVAYVTFKLMAKNSEGVTWSEPVRIQVLTSGRFGFPHIAPEGEALVYTLIVEQNRNYRLQVSEDLTHWEDLFEFRPVNYLITLGDLMTSPTRFYRLISP